MCLCVSAHAHTLIFLRLYSHVVSPTEPFDSESGKHVPTHRHFFRVSYVRPQTDSRILGIKQGNKANDLENVWSALQDLGLHLQNLNPNCRWWWNFHCTNGMWHFSELMMIEQVESERQTFSSWGRPAVWSSRGKKWTCCLTTSSKKKLSSVSQLEDKWETGAGRFLNRWHY